ANILLTPAGGAADGGEAARLYGAPKVTDFGLAKRLDAADKATQQGVLLGTPAYMAPEQARGCPEEGGPAWDIYALGAILYEMLTGRPLFTGDTALEIVQQVLFDTPVPPRELRPGLSRDLEAICLKCLARHPGNRYASALALADDLGRYLDGR